MQKDELADCLAAVEDKRMGLSGVLAYRRGATHVDTYDWQVKEKQPRLVSSRRFRHGTSLYSHQVLHAVFVPDVVLLASCSRQEEDGALVANFYEYVSGTLRKRHPIEHPCSQITYCPGAQSISVK